METNTQPNQKLIDRIYNYVAQLRDVRAVGLLFFLVIVLLISWSSVRVIETNYGLQKQIAQMEQAVAVRQLENDNLRLQNQYYDSVEYLELSARKNLGLAAPGEAVINVPKNVALSYTIDRGNDSAYSAESADRKKPFWQQNFQDWMDFLMHRQVQQP